MKNIKIATVLLFLYSGLNAQDAIFSQYFASQPYLNPALTGFFDGSYRINAHYRTQWTNISSGINTYGVNGEMKFGDHEGEKDFVGMGLGMYRDDLYGRVANNTIRMNLAYHKRLGYGETKHFLSIGTNLGMDYRQVNTNLIFPDEPAPYQHANIFVPNLGLGLNYQIVFPSFANVFFGGGVDHLISDKISIFNNNVQNEKRITVYSSARLRVNDAVYLIPTFLYAKQGAHKQINFGTAAQLLMREYYNNKTNFQIGVYGRLGNEGFDALIGMFRYENKGVQVGLSYDHALTELSSATGGFGALELSLGYIGVIEKVFKSRSECPNLKNF
jgi:type IX secretion system PorP/SprF family membrane protein